MKRDTLLAAAIGATLTDQPTPADKVGGDQGAFQRPPCGSCWHWRKAPAAGIGQGVCMHSPWNAIPIQGPQGQQGQMLVRPMLTADSEGCDQHKATAGGLVAAN